MAIYILWILKGKKETTYYNRYQGLNNRNYDTYLG